MSTEQLQFAFPSLDFAGTVITVRQMARKLGLSDQAVLNLAEEGELVGLDLKGRRAVKRCLRIPVECYRAFVLARATGQHRADFLRTLPRATLRELRRELDDLLRTAA